MLTIDDKHAFNMVYRGIGTFGDERDDYYGLSGLTINELRESRAVQKAQRMARYYRYQYDADGNGYGSQQELPRTWAEYMRRFEKALDFCLKER